ncbi:MAG: hypothetical protein M1818_002713 [Claussenomyces sp. TS43310]|nr:MAG: hypothetical protein M1818_002713 [Claussenomyces sp. TS43310]
MSPMFKKLLPGGTSACELESVFQCDTCLDCAFANSTGPAPAEAHNWEYGYPRDSNNLGMNDGMCQAAFPGLFQDIHRAVEDRNGSKVSIQELDGIQINNGYIRCMIYDRKLYILAANFRDQTHLERGTALVSAIHRSLTAMPHDYVVPNIEFVVSAEDYAPDARKPYWSLTRRSQDTNIWLMPDFAYWTWSMEEIGPYDAIVQQIIDAEEASNCWECKIKKAIWRGSIWPAKILRRALIDAARGKTWSDVQAMTDESSNHIHVVDQCEYMFNIHAEGRSYSGSLRYRQACRSVVIIHEMQWLQHYHYLMRADGEHQNYVRVKRDFSDLDASIEHLLAHPDEARRIADNNVAAFRERYLTPAAEACYWRTLFKAWATVSFEPQLYEEVDKGDGSGRAVRHVRGMRFENFV